VGWLLRNTGEGRSGKVDAVNMLAGDGFGRVEAVRLDSMGLMHCIEGRLDVYILSRIGD